jgi:hypothetical protein
VALRAEYFVVVRIEATFWELGKRLDMMYVEDDLRSATLANGSVSHSTVLALIAAQE